MSPAKASIATSQPDAPKDYILQIGKCFERLHPAVNIEGLSQCYQQALDPTAGHQHAGGEPHKTDGASEDGKILNRTESDKSHR